MALGANGPIGPLALEGQGRARAKMAEWPWAKAIGPGQGLARADMAKWPSCACINANIDLISGEKGDRHLKKFVVVCSL